MVTEVQSFGPVIGRDPQVLILGSMPGLASLDAAQYYAHPRNAFWPIMDQLFGIDASADYDIRIQQVSRQPVILWDTLRSCRRPGSLDSNIDIVSAQPNDFRGLMQRYHEIRAICFNGAASEKYFRRLVAPELELGAIKMLRLPSTSPANAGMVYAEKLNAWRRLLDFIEPAKS